MARFTRSLATLSFALLGVLLAGTLWPTPGLGTSLSVPASPAISGTITGPGGMPVEGASVVVGVLALTPTPVGGMTQAGTRAPNGPAAEQHAAVRHVTGQRSEFKPYDSGTVVLTDASGKYSYGPLADGSYAVLVYAPVGSTLVDGAYSATAPGHWVGDAYYGTQVAVTGTDVTDINVQLPLGHTVSGSITGPVSLAVEGAIAYFNGTHSYGFASGSAGASGGYTTGLLAPDDYTVYVSSPDGSGLVSGYYRDGAPGNFTADSSLATQVSLSGADVTDINVELPAGHTISGRISMPGALAVADAWVQFEGIGLGTWSDAPSALDGNYLSIALADDSYRIHVVAPTGSNLVSGYYRDGAPGNFTSDYSLATPVSVSGADVTDINVELPAGHTISGTITGPGQVAVAGAWVDVWGTASGATAGAYTDAMGNYTTGATGVDTYTVAVNAPWGTHLVIGYYRDGAPGNFTTDSSLATPVSVSGADVTDINVELPAGHTISGTITGPGQVAVAGAMVNVWGATLGGWSPAGSGTLGEFTTKGLVDDSYTVLVYAPTGSGLLDGYYSADAPGHYTADPGLATPVTITGADIINIDVELPLATYISGVVTAAGSSPVAGASVNVYLSDAGGPVRPAPRPHGPLDSGGGGGGITTDASGAYLAGPLAPGWYVVQVSPPTGSNLLSGYYREGAPGHFTTSQGLAMPVAVGGADVAGISVQLPQGHAVSGTITGPGAATLVGAYVSLYDSVSTSGNSGYSDAAGSYAVGQLPDGYYTVSVEAPADSGLLGGYYRAGAPGNYTSDAGLATVVPIAGADVAGISVTLPAGHTISGTVTGSDLKPLAGAQISIQSASTNAYGWANTDSLGAYTSSLLLAGSYTVCAYVGGAASGCYSEGAPGHYTADYASATLIPVTSADVTSIDFTLPILPPTSAHSIKGTIFGSDGSVLADASVSFSTPGGFGSSVWTGADGTYVFSGLADDSYTIYVDPAGAAGLVGGYYRAGVTHNYTADWTMATPVTIAGDDVTGIDVQLPLGHFISGTITGPDGNPLAGVSINVSWVGNLPVRPTPKAPQPHAMCPCGPPITDADGAFSVGPLADGTYTVQIFPPDGSRALGGFYGEGATGSYTADASLATPVVVAAADAGGINATLPGGHFIKGRITASDGSPIAGGQVQFLTSLTSANCLYSWYGQVAASTRVDGSFRSPALADGSYWLVVCPSFATGLAPVSYSAPASGHVTSVPSAATAVAVAGGDQTGISAVLPVMRGISGTVLDSSGMPVQGARICVAASGSNDGCPPWPWGWSGIGRPQPAASATHAMQPQPFDAGGGPAGGNLASTYYDGTFYLGVAPGSYILRVDTPVPSFYVAGGATHVPGNATVLSPSAPGFTGLVVQEPPADAAAPVVSTPGRSPATTVAGASVTVTATATDAGSYVALAQVSVDGGGWTAMAAADGAFGGSPEGLTASVTAPAGLGSHQVCVKATDAFANTSDGTACTTFTVVTPAANATLASLSLSAGALSPTFSGGTLAYSALVPNATASVTVTAAPSDPAATLQVRVGGGSWAALASGIASAALPLSVGANAVEVKVTASDGTTIATTTIAMTRAEAATAPVPPSGTPQVIPVSSDPDLGALTITVAGASDGASVTVEQAADPGASHPFAVSGSTVIVEISAPNTSGPYTVCLAGSSPARLWHYQGGTWADVTNAPPNDYVAGKVCGTTATLSPFALAESLDKTPPTAPGAPAYVVRTGASLSGTAVPVTVTWTAATDAGSAIDSYTLERSANGGLTWLPVAGGITGTSFDTVVPVSGTARFRVRATDTATNTGPWATGTPFTARLTQQTSSTVKWTGSWTLKKAAAFSGGSLKLTKKSSATASFKFTGRTIAIVSSNAWARGKVKVYINGKIKGTVDLRSATAANRVVVWSLKLSKSATWTVKLVAQGTRGRPQVDVDAFVVLK